MSAIANARNNAIPTQSKNCPVSSISFLQIYSPCLSGGLEFAVQGLSYSKPFKDCLDGPGYEGLGGAIKIDTNYRYKYYQQNFCKTLILLGFIEVAETEGFEPSIGLQTLYSLSRGAQSAPPVPLRSLQCFGLENENSINNPVLYGWQYGQTWGNLAVKLSTKLIHSIDVPGMYNDGNGLYLKITNSGNKSWICRVRHPVTKRLIDRKLGTPSNLSLKAAIEPLY